jgi:hypothetical protein
MDKKWMRPDQATLAANSIHAALDTTFDAFQKWEPWLAGAPTPDLVPVVQAVWEAVFTAPWLVRPPEPWDRWRPTS